MTVATIETLFLKLEAMTVDEGDTKFHEEIDQNFKDVANAGKQEDPRALLKDIFQRADIDQDRLLDVQELASWIHTKVTEHLKHATKENVELFAAIDNNPRNGEVTWEEYHAYFLKHNGHYERYKGSRDKKYSDMPRSLKESIMRERARWMKAVRNDPDKLAPDEFLAFAHPESSLRVLFQIVEDLLEKFDRDGDEQLTEDEFADLPRDEMGLDLKRHNHVVMGGNEHRRETFRKHIDKNKNGKANKIELLMYIDPRNIRYAVQEAQHLINVSDSDLDGKLNLAEILSRMELFLESKMVDTGRSFHDEF